MESLSIIDNDGRGNAAAVATTAALCTRNSKTDEDVMRAVEVLYWLSRGSVCLDVCVCTFWLDFCFGVCVFGLRASAFEPEPEARSWACSAGEQVNGPYNSIVAPANDRLRPLFCAASVQICRSQFDYNDH